MQGRNLFSCCAISAALALFQVTYFALESSAGVVPPAWSDPAINPCASKPGGWQLLYWSPLQSCFKIYTLGYPCPDTMELSPATFNGKMKAHTGNASAAECRCPPGTAYSTVSDSCQKLFVRGPCEKGFFFGPMPEFRTKNMRTGNRMGHCKFPHHCPVDMLFWPKDNKCYTKFTRGPCSIGKLLILNVDNLADCRCDNSGALKRYYYVKGATCHEHYTKGPCTDRGQLFLPGGVCGCHRNLPHFSKNHDMCFELNTPGPCPPGHVFNVPDVSVNSSNDVYYAQCLCKEAYIPWTDGHCYRPYTQGPCAHNELLYNTTCAPNVCGKGRLYFPVQKACYSIGTQGPCEFNKVVVFDFTTRPSIDGISYNGMCGCSGLITNLNQQCTDFDLEISGEIQLNRCEATAGMVEVNGNCYMLYSRGPCGPGQWLAPFKSQTTQQYLHSSKAKCICRTGYILDKNTADITYGVQRCKAATHTVR